MSTKDVKQKPKAKGRAPVTIPIAPDAESLQKSKGPAPFTLPKEPQ